MSVQASWPSKETDISGFIENKKWRQIFPIWTFSKQSSPSLITALWCSVIMKGLCVVLVSAHFIYRSWRRVSGALQTGVLVLVLDIPCQEPDFHQAWGRTRGKYLALTEKIEKVISREIWIDKNHFLVPRHCCLSNAIIKEFIKWSSENLRSRHICSAKYSPMMRTVSFSRTRQVHIYKSVLGAFKPSSSSGWPFRAQYYTNWPIRVQTDQSHPTR